jgi:hypothetical protein
MLPEDAWWPVRLGTTDGLIRGDDELDTEVVYGFGEGHVYHLERVDRGDDHRVWPNHASINQEGDLEVGEASTLADASTPAVHGHAAADDQSTVGSSLAATFRPALAAPSLVAASRGEMVRRSGSNR